MKTETDSKLKPWHLGFPLSDSSAGYHMHGAQAGWTREEEECKGGEKSGEDSPSRRSKIIWIT